MTSCADASSMRCCSAPSVGPATRTRPDEHGGGERNELRLLRRQRGGTVARRSWCATSDPVQTDGRVRCPADVSLIHNGSSVAAGDFLRCAHEPTFGSGRGRARGGLDAHSQPSRSHSNPEGPPSALAAAEGRALPRHQCYAVNLRDNPSGRPHPGRCSGHREGRPCSRAER